MPGTPGIPGVAGVSGSVSKPGSPAGKPPMPGMICKRRLEGLAEPGPLERLWRKKPCRTVETVWETAGPPAQSELSVFFFFLWDVPRMF